MRTAIIDIGSNTIKSAIYEIDKDKQFQCIHRKTLYLGLLSYIENKNLTDKGIDALASSIKILKDVAISLKCEKIYAFATAALRMSENNALVISQIIERVGIKIDLIDGDTEAKLTYESAAASTPDMKSEGICVDLGGGSCEIIYFKDSQINKLVSLPLGTLLLYEKFVLNIIPTLEEFNTVCSFVSCALKDYDELFKCENVYLIGGSARAVVKILKACGDLDPTLPCAVPLDLISSLSSNILALKMQYKRLLMKEVPERAHTLMTGLAVFTVLAEKCSAKKLIVTDASVRDGYLKERLI